MKSVFFSMMAILIALMSGCCIFKKKENSAHYPDGILAPALGFSISLQRLTGGLGMEGYTISVDSTGRVSGKNGTSQRSEERQLTATEIEALQKAVAEADFFNQPDHIPSTDRDVRLSYFELKKDGRQKRIGFKNQLPPELRALEGMLERLAKE